MTESFEVSDVIPASPKQIYEAWLDTKGHSEMTGGDATVEGTIGGKFAAWNGALFGENLELEPYRRIVQSWRTGQFSDDDADSRIEVALEETEGGTRLTVNHSNIPDGQADGYNEGWHGSYFEPMKKHFGGS